MLALLFSLFTLVRAESISTQIELAQAAPPAQGKPIELNGCVPYVSNREASAQSAAKYANLSGVEVLARLIYSEALSTGYWKGRCNAPSATEIMDTIGWGLMNRVRGHRSKADPYYATVFQPGHFNTSFSNDRGNPFAKSFLCPLMGAAYLASAKDPSHAAPAYAAKLYAESQQIALSISEEYEKKGIPEKYSRITNFFYPRSEFYGELRPTWAPNPNPKLNKGYVNLLNADNPCVEFYRL